MLDELIVSFWIDLKATWLQSDSRLAAAPLTPGTLLVPDSDLEPILSPMKEGAQGQYFACSAISADNLTQNTNMSFPDQEGELQVNSKRFSQTLNELLFEILCDFCTDLYTPVWWSNACCRLSEARLPDLDSQRVSNFGGSTSSSAGDSQVFLTPWYSQFLVGQVWLAEKIHIRQVNNH